MLVTYRFGETFKSDKLVFDPYIDDEHDKYSNLFSEGFQTIKNEFLNFDIHDDERRDFMRDFQTKLSTYSPSHRLENIEDAWRASVVKLKKRRSSCKQILSIN